MADNSVFITGAASGAFTDALSGMPPWATEKTLRNIEGTLKQSLNISKQLLSKLGKSGGTGLDPKDMDELNKIFRTYNNTLNRNNTHETEREKKRTARWDRELLYGKKLETRNEKLLFVFGELSRWGAKIQDTMKENVNTYAQLQQGGINVVAGFNDASTGFTSLQQLTAQTGVRFTELSATMLKYSNAVNAFTAGKFAKTVGQVSTQLQQFGFTSKESGELLGSYLESQAGFTDISNQTQAETTAKVVKFGSAVSKASMVTGMSKNAILANIEAISKSNEASILSANLGEEAATSTLAFISSMKDQNLGKAFLKMMSDQIKPLNATFMSFQKIGLGGFGQKLMNFTQSLKGMSPEAAAQAVKAFEEQNHAAIEAGKQQANLYSQIPELAGEAQAALTTFNGLQQQARTTRKMNDDEIAKMEKSNAARSKLATQWETLMSKMQLAFGAPISLLNLLANSLEIVNNGFDLVITSINKVFGDEATSWIGAGIAAAGMFGLLLKTLPAVTKWLSVFGKSLPGTGGSGAGRAAGAAGSAGEGLLGGLGKGLSGLGKGIAGLGKGIGGAVGGMLEGLAKGLSALGNPKVLLGVVSLAGIAASLWITGKAVQQFVGLDWETLGKAGVALVALGVAGAAAGLVAPEMLLGAAAFAALGASIWIIGKALEAVGTGLNSIGSIFANVSTGLNSLSASLDSFKNLDKLKDIIGTINSINLLKAAAFAAISAVSPSAPASSAVSVPKTPSSTTIDSPSAKKSGDKQPASPAAENPSTPVGAGIEKPPAKADINSMMSFQNSLLEQLLLSTNNLVSVNKDILKYTKAHQ